MPGPESVRGYLDAVEAQIRWKRARTVAARELVNHFSWSRVPRQDVRISAEEAAGGALL